jgi:hypothetical protein
VSHPSLGLPPVDLTAGSPAASARLLDQHARLAARALEVALDRTPGLRERWDEEGLTRLLNDVDALNERVALSVAAGDPQLTHGFAESLAPVYRRRKVPMDDLIALCEGLRAAYPSVLTPVDLPAAGAALDAAIEAFRWHRRLAGDARKKNAFLQLLYKGA